MQPAIFLDRDGVIIRNRHSYVRSLAQVSFYRHSLSALVKLSQQAVKLVIITNQSAVGRGMLSLETAHQINQYVVAEAKFAGARIDGVFMCPHQPEVSCSCRKPEPGLILQAAGQMDIDLVNSILIGDALSDLSAGQNAGIKQTILLLTGRGLQQLRRQEAATLKPFLVYRSLAHAANHIHAWLPARTV